MCYWRCSVLLGLLWPTSAWAGMPAPLPTEWRTVSVLTDWTQERLQAISFFLVALVLCAGMVQLLWNYIRRDLSNWPRLSYGKALAGVVLWGLLFIVVLTMISGARELMTPGAWQKQGLTYKLATPVGAQPTTAPDVRRRQQLERLRTALWHFAATHQGRFPTAEETTAIPRELWEIPDGGGLRYLYAPGLTAGHSPALLAWEPELDPEERLVLRVNGDILRLRSTELVKSVSAGEQP